MMSLCPRWIKSVLILMLFFSCAKFASAIAEADELSLLARKVNLGDLAHTFTSDYSTVESCPEKIEVLSKPIYLDGIIAEVNVSSIKENGEKCRGSYSSKFTLVPEAMINDGSLLKKQGFSENFFALRYNSAARFLLKQNKTVLVGFISGNRTCGKLFYPENTFWFFTNIPRDVNTIPVHIEGRVNITLVKVPANSTALVVSDGKNKVCVLTDKRNQKVHQVQITEVPYAPMSPNNSSFKPSKVTPAAVNKSKNNQTAVQVPSDTLSDTPYLQNIEPSPIITPETVDNVCFPSYATVQLEDGSEVSMAELRIGDRVRTGRHSYSDVFMFTHRDMNVRAKFVHLTTASGFDIVLTPSHYLYSNGKLAAASTVNVGDELSLGNGTYSKVEYIKTTLGKGLYNPQTLDGSIVVDGIIASTYTTSVHPMFAHGGLLSPLRAMYNLRDMWSVFSTIESFVGKNRDTLSRFVPRGPAAFI